MIVQLLGMRLERGRELMLWHFRNAHLLCAFDMRRFRGYTEALLEM